MPTISEPIDWDIRNARASQLRQYFIIGWLGEHTFRASLRILGLRDQDLEAEVASAKRERKA